MTIVNLTPHAIHVYDEAQFINIEKTSPTTLVADGVEGSPVLEIPSTGQARVKVATVQADPVDGIPTVTTQYGDIEGLPDYESGTFYVVSLLTISAAVKNGRTTVDLLAPNGVVRSRANGSLVLGCTGFTRA